MSDGTFGTVGYNCVGDPYQDKQKLINVHESRGKRQFVTCTPKKGKTAATFGSGVHQAKPLFSGDPYDDPHRGMARARMENRAKFLTPNGFKFSSPTRRAVGPGDPTGVFSSPDYVPDGVHARRPRKRQGEVTVGPRQILTSPSKRGTYGYAGTTLAPFRHQTTDYDIDFEERKLERARHLERIGERKAFRAPGRAKPFFDCQEHVEAPRSLAGPPPPAPEPQPTDGMTARQIKEAEEENARRPFVPSSPTRTGQLATLSPLPEAVPDPYDTWAITNAMMPARLHPARKRMKDLPESIRDRKPFKPTSGVKSGYTKGTYLMGIHSHHIA